MNGAAEFEKTPNPDPPNFAVQFLLSLRSRSREFGDFFEKLVDDLVLSIRIPADVFACLSSRYSREFYLAFDALSRHRERTRAHRKTTNEPTDLAHSKAPAQIDEPTIPAIEPIPEPLEPTPEFIEPIAA